MQEPPGLHLSPRRRAVGLSKAFVLESTVPRQLRGEQFAGLAAAAILVELDAAVVALAGR